MHVTRRRLQPRHPGSALSPWQQFQAGVDNVELGCTAPACTSAWVVPLSYRLQRVAAVVAAAATASLSKAAGQAASTEADKHAVPALPESCLNHCMLVSASI